MTGINPDPKPSNRVRRWMKRIAWGCSGLLVLLVGLIVLLFLFLNQVPKSYPAASHPMDPPSQEDYAHFELDGFDSPYLGHTGSWDGKGGAMWGGSKAEDMDKEVTMGLRWTFMPVNWRVLEPDGPVNLSTGIPPAWKALDSFVREAEKRKLNILMQAPVVGGNAEGPPDWAGRREAGKSAPHKMDAAAEFAGKLAARYKPGGILATEQGWGKRYGVRAWEIDNEPEMYRTHWKGQAGDYAELATKAAAEIRMEDSRAMIVLPGVASGNNKFKWLEAALDAHGLGGSPGYREKAIPYSIGPVADAVSFHVYEGLDSAFSATPRTVEVTWGEVRELFENWESRSSGFHYPRKREYWHTEGNFDFIGALSGKRRAAWRMQFFTRAFAAGIRKVCVMDASDLEQTAVKTYVETLPWPFPMERADQAVKVVSGQVVAYVHKDGRNARDGRVWILWAVPGSGDAIVDVPVVQNVLAIAEVDGSRRQLETTNGFTSVKLTGDKKMAPPRLIVDRPQTVRP